MEPDILATTRDPLADAIGRGPSSDEIAEHPADDHSMPSNGRSELALRERSASGAAAGGPAHRPGTRLNGHPINGHAHVNGNGHYFHVNGMSNEPLAAVAGSGISLARTLVPAVTDARRREASFYLRSGKRVLDVVGAAVGLVLAIPVMIAIAIAIKIESRGPVFYRSTRIGRGGRPFTFLKFRSMVDGADRHRQHLTHLNECDGPVFKISRDPRVTGIGRFLRVTSMDEIPQFLNVLRGEMSLVGPRPPLPEEVTQYEPWQMRRLEVRPGLTCLWQISGRSRIGFREWMRLDLEYIKHQSFWLDLRILLRTIPAVMSRDGAY
jgi:lipopolysaccharide/colanic/teichoic acid biosynthesis glycosyltransferase